MAEVQFEVVLAAEGVSVDALWGQRVHIVIIASVLAKEARARCVMPFGGDLELNNHLLALSRTAKMHGLLAMGTFDIVLSPVLIELHF